MRLGTLQRIHFRPADMLESKRSGISVKLYNVKARITHILYKVMNGRCHYNP